jgi:hypothetical protein
MQTKYGLVLSHYTPKMAHPLSVLINETFLVVWGLKALGGLELNTNIYNVQKISYFFSR